MGESRRSSQQGGSPATPMREIVTAILVDGGFYRRRARSLFGEKTPEQRTDELTEYCRRHIRKSRSHRHR